MYGLHYNDMINNIGSLDSGPGNLKFNIKLYFTQYKAGRVYPSQQNVWMHTFGLLMTFYNR